MGKKKSPSGFDLAVYAFLIIATVYMLVTGLGGTKTFWGWDARHSGWVGKVLMFIPLIVICYIVYKNPYGISKGTAALFLALLGFGFAASTGFKFTGGDIKQTITFINLDGKISDVKGFKQYYGKIYNLDTDTATSNYIDKYHELPGVNNWAFNICCALPASTRHPRSTAPRADENYEWSTGSYEMDLKKVGGK
jgi:hypothetical protein